MSISYVENERLFSLQTKNTSYLFQIYEENPNYKDSTKRLALRSLYWGKKVSRIEDFVRPFNWYL